MVKNQTKPWDFCCLRLRWSKNQNNSRFFDGFLTISEIIKDSQRSSKIIKAITCMCLYPLCPILHLGLDIPNCTVATRAFSGSPGILRCKLPTQPMNRSTPNQRLPQVLFGAGSTTTFDRKRMGKHWESPWETMRKTPSRAMGAPSGAGLLQHSKSLRSSHSSASVQSLRDQPQQLVLVGWKAGQSWSHWTPPTRWGLMNNATIRQYVKTLPYGKPSNRRWTRTVDITASHGKCWLLQRHYPYFGAWRSNSD